MNFFQIVVPALYFCTPLVIAYSWFRLARVRPPTPTWPMVLALGLWLLQAAVLIYFVSICLSGHCRLTIVEEAMPAVLMGGAYIAIAWLLWITWKKILNTDNESR